jgi:hypothetical protein
LVEATALHETREMQQSTRLEHNHTYKLNAFAKVLAGILRKTDQQVSIAGANHCDRLRLCSQSSENIRISSFACFYSAIFFFVNEMEEQTRPRLICA